MPTSGAVETVAPFRLTVNVDRRRAVLTQEVLSQQACPVWNVGVLGSYLGARRIRPLSAVPHLPNLRVQIPGNGWKTSGWK